ncbi:hypothetical protein [Rouxiella sp. WC2420]
MSIFWPLSRRPRPTATAKTGCQRALLEKALDRMESALAAR